MGMPDNYIQGHLAIDAIPYVKKRVRRYTVGVLQAECVALFRRFTEEETTLCFKVS